MKNMLKTHSAAWRMLILPACCFTFLARPASSQVHEAANAAYGQLFSIHAGMEAPSASPVRAVPPSAFGEGPVTAQDDTRHRLPVPDTSMRLVRLWRKSADTGLQSGAREFTYAYTGLPRYAFSDSAPLSELIISAIDGTGSSIDVALYNLSIMETAEALLRAKNRGVRVRIILDEKHVFPKRNTSIQFIMDNGFDLRVMRGKGKAGTMHNKFAICDGTVLMTGSCNWSVWAASMNYEDLEFIQDPKLVGGYRQFWDWMWTQSVSADEFPAYSGVSYTQPPFDPNPPVSFNGTMLPAYSFSPLGGTEEAIIKAIKASRRSIDVAMFSFFSEKLAQTLALAQKNGVEVSMVVDRSQGWQSPMVKFVIDNGVKLRWIGGMAQKGMMHHKFAVFDGKLLEAGTYNWTGSAENSNAENIYFTADPDRVNAFLGQFKKLYSRARPPTSRDLMHYSKSPTPGY